MPIVNNGANEGDDNGLDMNCVQSPVYLEKWPLRRPRKTWEDNIIIDHREIGGEDVR